MKNKSFIGLVSAICFLHTITATSSVEDKHYKLSDITYHRVPWMEDDHLYKITIFHHYKELCLGYFGQAPDYSNTLSKALLFDRFLRLNGITDVICLDSRRALSSARHTVNSPYINSKTLLPFLRSKTYVTTHTDSHMGDKLELYTALSSSQTTTKEVFTRLEKGGSLKKTLQDLDVPCHDIEAIAKEIAEAHNIRPSQIDALQFFPTKEKVDPIVNLLLHNVINDSNATVMMFCGGGKGRTGLFLALFIRQLCHCSFAEALTHLGDTFLDPADVEEVQDYANYVESTL